MSFIEQQECLRSQEGFGQSKKVGRQLYHRVVSYREFIEYPREEKFCTSEFELKLL